MACAACARGVRALCWVEGGNEGGDQTIINHKHFIMSLKGLTSSRDPASEAFEGPCTWELPMANRVRVGSGLGTTPLLTFSHVAL